MPAVLPWPDTPIARIEALALVETLNADLLSHDSATLTLDRWCADHRLAEPARGQQRRGARFGHVVRGQHLMARAPPLAGGQDERAADSETQGVQAGHRRDDTLKIR